jgi:hypothetical protein
MAEDSFAMLFVLIIVLPIVILVVMAVLLPKILRSYNIITSVNFYIYLCSILDWDDERKIIYRESNLRAEDRESQTISQDLPSHEAY